MHNDVGLRVVLQPDEPRHRLVRLLAGLVGVDLGDAPAITTAVEVVAFQIGADRAGVRGVLRHDQHERVDGRPAALAGIEVQLDFHVLVIGHAVGQHNALQLVGGDAVRAEVGRAWRLRVPLRSRRPSPARGRSCI